MTKLNWDYDQHFDCEVAFHNGYRIRAERDDDARNPFTEWEGHWPMIVRYDGRETTYGDPATVGGSMVNQPLDRFNDAHLVHDQKAIAEALGADKAVWEDWHEKPAPKWITHAGELRAWFEDAMGDVPGSKRLDTFAELYHLLGIPYVNTSSTGYSQGDYADVLVVVTPEAQKALRSQPEDMSDEDWKVALAEDMQNQVGLYSAWAWGDVYGYVIEKPIFDADGEIEDWEDACDDNSCWGYYGADHDKSGLEEQALASVPEEPVASPDKLTEEQLLEICDQKLAAQMMDLDDEETT